MKRDAYAVALAVATALSLTSASCGDEATRPPPVAPAPALDLASPAPALAPAPAPPPAPSPAAEPPPAAPVVPEPAFGSEPLLPDDPHPFRLAAAVRAIRANRSGANVVKMLSLLPEIIDSKKKTGVDPFTDGDWLLVYGPTVGVPGSNAHVLKHTKSEADVSAAMSRAGITADGHVQLYGVRDTLVRPQPGLLALLPNDRAKELAAVLAKPIDTGLRPGELAQIFVAEPSKVVKNIPDDVRRANVVVKPASDGGLDARAVADCRDAASCTAAATELDEYVKRQNSFMVRLVLKNLLANFAVKASGAKLEATLHASPDQVDALLSILRAQLGLPPPAQPGDPKH